LAPKMGNILTETERASHIKFLQQSLGAYRFVSTAEFMPVRGISIYTGDYFKRPPFIQSQYWSLSPEEFKSFKKYRQTLSLLSPNIFTAYNLASINGYSTFVLKNFNNYFSSPSQHLSLSAQRVMEVRRQNKDTADPTRVNFDFINLDDSRLSDLSVKYILADEKLNLKNHRLVYDDGKYFIYENEKVLARAQVFDKKNQLKLQPEIIDVNPNKVKINLGNYQYQDGDYLLLRDTYYPGWKAYDQDNRQLKLTPQLIFRRVNLTNNSHTVIFRFQPKSFYLGLKISLASISLIFALFLFNFFKSFKAKKNPLKKLQFPFRKALKK